MGLFDIIGNAYNAVNESAEKKKKTREYIKSAKENVQAGEKIYNDAYNKVMDTAGEVKYKMDGHTEYKQRLAKELGSTISPVLSEFKSFDIDSRTFVAPEINDRISGLDVLDVSSISHSVAPNFPILSIADIFASDEDYYEAKRQYDDSKFFRQNMKHEKERLMNCRAKLLEIKRFIGDEQRELDSLMDKLRKLATELKGGMQKNSFTPEEADYLKCLQAIGEQISVLLSTTFLTDNLSITDSYKETFEKVKQVNNQIPSSPTIHDCNLSTLVKLLDIKRY